ncbi:Druantia anti-phage system protein DruA [Pseudomonas syringae]|uniref:Uncharacterized protein n=2 Tax=Pseudomonas syringae TaxID=317 RepID=A0A0P9J2E6_PSESX|nr:Druantia anti-phage system protein DruA [Pseudomonas syringae]EGH70933.1 hypothetical protein PSYAR_10264 [Pseudomonas syringae pv. aceris str. M302273]KPW17217.1 Uncharacterized protein ALO91_02069 [Pseudomonas syringae pv. aceris]PBP49469.1 hypothetical protein CCL11_05475 [Pseudomonas syringae]
MIDIMRCDLTLSLAFDLNLVWRAVTKSAIQMDLLASLGVAGHEPIATISDEEMRLLLSEDIHSAWTSCQESNEAGDKDLIRALHLAAKKWDRSVDYASLRRELSKLSHYFPHGRDIDPAKINAELILVKERSLEEKFFKIARGYWSMPYSRGYGRRLRFVLMDTYHEAVIGIIGLQSPSADLACRDKYLGAPKDKKLEFVNNTLDAFTIGATPAYSSLLGGKLVAGHLHSEKIRQAYWALYGNKVTTQLEKRVPQPLLAITTASAFGRSSIYNRLKYADRVLATPLGYTKGYGTIHLEQLYPKIVEWLKSTGRHVPAGFGNGPKVRWQNIMRTLNDLGISRKYLSHGIKREVFIFELVHNLIEVCRDEAIPDMAKFDDQLWTDYWRDRWCLPRSVRDERWRSVDTQEIMLSALG